MFKVLNKHYIQNEETGEHLNLNDACDLLNEQDAEIKRLKVQLQTDDVCSKCKHEYLVKQDSGYFIAKCKKGFSECQTDDVTLCEYFELKGDVE